MSNTYESELQLENSLIEQLQADLYERVVINNEAELEANFRKQIVKHNLNRLQKEYNKNDLSDKEFERLMVKIKGKGVFNSAFELRQLQVIKSDDDKDLYIELFNRNDWCQNIFQVTNQTTVKGKYENRYDVTLLVNGLPLVQIELKRKGLDFKEAFNQICRYKKHSLSNGLYNYIQFFVISNGVDTKYFANSDKELSFQFTFYWSDVNNERPRSLFEFTTYFLARCHVAKMIARYMVLDQTTKSLMIMRPYQVWAVKKLMIRATETNNNAYVWHTTGSGKTLTSFKLSQLLASQRNVEKVFFLVDRKDLDSQTLEEFNKFQPDTVDMTDSTEKLVSYINDSTKPLILTTIQKMANACKNDKYKTIIEKFIDKKVVFIIDECHRSQFGDMHKEINRKFPKAQYFGFTGTPRLANVNPSADGRSSADIFEKMEHSYLIKDAIKDGNVLGFSVDYVKTINKNFDEEDETKVEAIDTAEAIKDPKRIELIVTDIIKSFNAKTRNKMYNALLTVKSIEILQLYYKEFKRQEHDLTIGTIFTYGQNEDAEGKDEHSRDFLEKAIDDYNKIYETNFSTQNFSNYFKDISKKIKNNQINLVIVVDMLLTGFDAKCLNTLYVDKRLKYHNLIQAFSRTNRIEKTTKPYGNIVCYQTTKKAVDEAVRKFSDTSTTDVVLMETYDYYESLFINEVKLLKKDFSNPYDIQIGGDEYLLKQFADIFKKMLTIKVSLETFVEFDFDKDVLGISRQEFEEYQSKYFSIARERNERKEKVSILDDIDFCIELIRNDKINVQYILNLLQDILSEKDLTKRKKTIEELLEKIEVTTNDELRYKAQLLKRFIDDIIPTLDENSVVYSEFDNYMKEQREIEINEISDKYKISNEIISNFIADYEFSGIIDANEIKKEIPQDTISMIKNEENLTSSLSAKKSIAEKIKQFIMDLFNKF